MYQFVKTRKLFLVSILCCSTVSNVADVGGADGSDDEQVELAQEQEAATPDMEIGVETEDSQSSPGTSSRLTTPLPLTPVSRPTPGKRIQHGPKKDIIEEKLLEIIQKPESKPDEEELFCLNLAAKLRKIKDPQKREYAQLQLQQTLYNCMYGDASQPQPQQMPQQMPQQFPTLMAHQQSSSSSSLQSYDYTMSSDGSTFTSI